MGESVQNLDAQLKAMDKARDEMVNTPTTSPDEAVDFDDEDEEMMNFEDELDKMEDAFDLVQDNYGMDSSDDAEEIEEDKRRKRRHHKCKGTDA
jgi:hypothetical protein